MNDICNVKPKYISNLNDCKIFLMEMNDKYNSNKLLELLESYDLNLSSYQYEYSLLQTTNDTLTKEIEYYKKN